MSRTRGPGRREDDHARVAGTFPREHREAWAVRLADEEHAFPGYEVGAMPPFGNLYDVPVCAHRTLSDDETIVFRAATHTDTMSVAFANFERLVEPTVANFADSPSG